MRSVGQIARPFVVAVAEFSSVFRIVFLSSLRNLGLNSLTTKNTTSKTLHATLGLFSLLSVFNPVISSFDHFSMLARGVNMNDVVCGSDH